MSSAEKKYSNRIYIWLLIGAAVLVLFDQLIKHLAVIYLKGSPSFVLIPGVLELQYLENAGAAWGILQGKQFIFTIITVVFMIFAIIFIVKLPKTRKFLPLLIALIVLCSGALGNFYDRLVHKYVVDFIYFSIIDFPIFNVADIYVTLSVIAIIIMVLFRYKDNDFDFLKKKKAEENA